MSGPLQFRYGGYSHEAGEVTIASISVRADFSARGEPVLSRMQWQIQGQLNANDPADLTAKLRNLEGAYNNQAQDAGLYFVGGGPTAHYLPNGTSIGGVRSLGVSYPKGDGAEYTTFRNYSITLEADYPFAGTNLLEYRETLRFVGTCGPEWIYLFPLTGEPERQQVLAKTTQKVTQSGSAMGFLSRPSPPPPLWPANEHEQARTIGPTSPRVLRGRQIDFGIEWSYEFESATPLNGSGSPHTG